MSLLSTLNNLNSGMYQNTSHAWVQYLQDHYRYLKSAASWQPVTDEQMEMYRYRLRDFLVEQAKYEASLLWYVLWLNQWQTEGDFEQVSGFWLPPVELIRDLRRLYLTEQTKLQRS